MMCSNEAGDGDDAWLRGPELGMRVACNGRSMVSRMRTGTGTVHSYWGWGRGWGRSPVDGDGGQRQRSWGSSDWGFSARETNVRVGKINSNIYGKDIAAK